MSVHIQCGKRFDLTSKESQTTNHEVSSDLVTTEAWEGVGALIHGSRECRSAYHLQTDHMDEKGQRCPSL